MKRQFILALPFVATMGLASAQVTAIGPFVGDESDSFETQLAFSFDPCVVGRVFNNMGDLCASAAHITSGWGFMCTIFPNSGSRLYGSAGGASTYTFDSPVQRFGGYFGTNSWSAPSQGTVTVDFLDSNGGMIDSVVLTNFFGDCTWYWNGWQASGPIIKEIVVTNSQFSGGFIDMDDMEISYTAGGPVTIGQNFECTATVPNSTGQPGVLAATGSDVAANNDVTLTATQLPDNQFGYFLNSMSQNPAGFIPAGSQGRLCIGPAGIGRYNQPAEIFNTGNTGMGALVLDLPNTPVPTAPFFTSIQAGETWYFTSWYRDNNPGSTSNFTDAVCITFN